MKTIIIFIILFLGKENIFILKGFKESTFYLEDKCLYFLYMTLENKTKIRIYLFCLRKEKYYYF